eukprot:6476899-Amphidinium_carterae.4
MWVLCGCGGCGEGVVGWTAGRSGGRKASGCEWWIKSTKLSVAPSKVYAPNDNWQGMGPEAIAVHFV